MSNRSDPSGFNCPVCGYPGLTEPSHDETGFGSFDICPSCGVEFGYDDFAVPHRALRYRWLMNGAKWYSTATVQPLRWSAGEQLRAAGLDAAASTRYLEMPLDPPPTFDATIAALKDWLGQWAPGIDNYRLKYFEEKLLQLSDGRTLLAGDQLHDFESLRQFFEELQSERKAWIELRGYGRVRNDEYWIGVAFSRLGGFSRTKVAFVGSPTDASGKPREWAEIELI